MGNHRFKQSEGVGGIIAEELLRHLHRFASFDESGEMHHGVDGVFLKQPIESGAIGDVSLNELGRGRYGSTVAFREIVVDDHLIAALQELGDDHAPDIASPTGNEHAFCHQSLFANESERIRSATKTKFSSSRTIVVKAEERVNSISRAWNSCRRSPQIDPKYA